MIDREQADLLLTTTRSVRKRLDFSRPVPDELIAECIEIALQAPTASNMQGWSFVVVTDQAKRDAIGEIYRRGFQMLYRTMPDLGYAADDPRAVSQAGVVRLGHLPGRPHPGGLAPGHPLHRRAHRGGGGA